MRRFHIVFTSVSKTGVKGTSGENISANTLEEAIEKVKAEHPNKEIIIDNKQTIELK